MRKRWPAAEYKRPWQIIFNESGYETAYVGKWHLASTEAVIRLRLMKKNYETRAIRRNAGAGIGIIDGGRCLRRPPMDTMDYVFDREGKM